MKFKLKPRILLAVIIIPLGLIIAAVPENTTKRYKLTAEELLTEVSEGRQFISVDQIAQMLIEKDPSLQLVDVRKASEFEKFCLPNAINIPLENLLNPDNEEILNQEIKLNVFYSNSSNSANQAWMITRQLGYKNNYILQGGLNYWAETILNPETPSETSPDEEIAKYNFRMGANKALGGEIDDVGTGTITPKSAPPKPVIQKTRKKKGVAGGC